MFKTVMFQHLINIFKLLMKYFTVFLQFMVYFTLAARFISHWLNFQGSVAPGG